MATLNNCQRSGAFLQQRGAEGELGALLPATEILLHFLPHTFPPDFYPGFPTRTFGCPVGFLPLKSCSTSTPQPTISHFSSRFLSRISDWNFWMSTQLLSSVLPATETLLHFHPRNPQYHNFHPNFYPGFPTGTFGCPVCFLPLM